MSHALQDGLYLCAWPSVAAVAPPAAFVIGAFLGGHFFLPSDTFTSSVWILLYLVTVSSFSAALGVWTAAGYILMDMIYYDHQFFIYTTLGWHYPNLQRLVSRVPFLITYFLLFVLLSEIPIIARRLNGVTTSISAISRKALIQGLLIYFWMEAAPILIRPEYVWNNQLPDANAIAPMQEKGWLLAFAALFLSFVRGVIERRQEKCADVVRRRKELEDASEAAGPLKEHRVPTFWLLLAKTAATVFLLSGMLTEWWEIPILMAGAAFLYWKQNQATRPATQALLRRIPFAFRFIGATVIAYALGYGIVAIIGEHDTATFLPIILALTFSLVVFAFLIPKQKLIGPRDEA